MDTTIDLIVGLGNPGPEYDNTRHNAGAWFAEKLAEFDNATFRPESKFHGLSCKISIDGNACRLLLPTTFMNHSGQAVSAIAKYYQIKPANILVAHDDLDLPAGEVKLKFGGGHGGHNGLRDIISALGTNEFYRLRLGINHPGHRDVVLDYVLKRPSINDKNRIYEAIDLAIAKLPLLLGGKPQEAMKQIHTK